MHSLKRFLAAVSLCCAANVGAETADFGPAVDINEVKAGSLLLQGQEAYHQAPRVDTEVSMRITGMIARVAVRQSFTNPTSVWTNGVYVFPLPEDAAVDHLKMSIGEREIEGQIEEREAARKTFEVAKAAGKKASLVAQQRPNIFTNTVANIGPGETVTVAIEYQQTLGYEKGKFSIRFPMTIGIRYIPGSARLTGFDGGGWAFNSDQVPDASTITPPVTETHEGHRNPVSMTVELNAGFPVQEIASPYHDVQVTNIGRYRYRVDLSKATIADRDFVLFWRPQPEHAPRAALFNQQAEDGTYGLMMVIPPEEQWVQQATLPREIIYVIDTSGSMSGTSINQARRALLYGLSRLRGEDRFNVVQFNSHTSALSPQALPASAANLSKAQHYVSSLSANGGTEIASALTQVLTGEENPQRVRQVVFLTDGSVGNEARLFEIIEQRLADSRLFTVGIGSAPNSHFMREAASIGRGTFTYIGKVDEVETEMGALFDKLQYPVLSNVRLEWASGNDGDYWPNPIRDLYIHEPLVVSYRLDTPEKSVRVAGQLAGQSWHQDLTINGSAKAAGLDVLWARKKIASLSQSLSRGAPRDAVTAAITQLGLKHHIVTAHTSLVAVDVTPTRPAGETANDAHIPLKKPSGWTMATSPTRLQHARLPQTATPALLYLLLGALFSVVGLLTHRGLWIR
ncbi:MAG: marine proteobacterial sortase target protein [Pseudomonadota bacterium]